jgi:hypothetical protein
LLANDSLADLFPSFCGVNLTLSDNSSPAGMVKGNETPGTANCELLLDNDEMVTLPPPARNPSVSVSVVPTLTLPKLSVPGIIAKCGLLALVPVPVSGTRRAAPEIDKLPSVKPSPSGLNAAFNLTLSPAARVRGNLAPLTENALPVICTLFRVTRSGRVFISTTGNVELSPTPTLPNDKLAGLAITSPITPVPAVSNVTVRSEASLITVICPLSQPFAVGAKITDTLSLAPAGRIFGSFNFESSNLRLLESMPEILTLS